MNLLIILREDNRKSELIWKIGSYLDALITERIVGAPEGKIIQGHFEIINKKTYLTLGELEGLETENLSQIIKKGLKTTRITRGNILYVRIINYKKISRHLEKLKNYYPYDIITYE